MPVGLIVYQGTGGFGETKALQTLHLFNNREDADAAFNTILEATKAWQERKNEREQFITITPLNGIAALDVSHVIALGVDDCLEENARKALEEWNEAVATIKAKGPKND